jgi:uncharacterized protein
MKLDAHNQLKCDLYRRQLIQNGATEHWANTQAAILAQCYEARQEAQAMQRTYETRLARLRATLAAERRWCRGAIALAGVSGWIVGAAIGWVGGVVF